jgi:hypothetical protein
MTPRPAILVLALLMSSCGRSTEVVTSAPADANDAAHVLVVTTSKTTYSWDEVGPHGGGIVATIVNPVAHDYFSRVGDGFNSSMDQPTTYIAMGTEATVERQKRDASWSAVPTGILIEGSRVVALRGSGRYQLRGILTEPSQVGTLRIRLRYRASTEPDAPILTDYSAPFYVRQVFTARPRGR